MDKRLVTTAVVALLIGGAVVALVLQKPPAALPDPDPSIVVKSDCQAVFKGDAKAFKGKPITWTVLNLCQNSVTVTLGNFRSTEASGQGNCDAATEGGFEWPFNGDDNANRRQATVQGANQGNAPFRPIPLVLKNTVVAGTYYFDVCVGQTKVDPRLVVE